LNVSPYLNHARSIPGRLSDIPGTRLSNLTGNLEYANLAQRGEHHLLRPRPATGEPFPGLIGYSINIDTGEIESNQVSWGGGHDSYYEYLIKMYVYDRNRYGEYRER
jgi:mannosyl-oligosaccharide alpha-1,2-mannosidase